MCKFINIIFKEEATQIEEVTNKDNTIEDMEPDTCIITIMQESLEMATEISRLHGARVSSLKDVTRKMYVQSAQKGKSFERFRCTNICRI